MDTSVRSPIHKHVLLVVVLLCGFPTFAVAQIQEGTNEAEVLTLACCTWVDRETRQIIEPIRMVEEAFAKGPSRDLVNTIDLAMQQIASRTQHVQRISRIQFQYDGYVGSVPR